AIIRYGLKRLLDELKEKIEHAPQFFINSPVLIILDRLKIPEALLKVADLLTICRKLDLQPIGFSGIPVVVIAQVTKTGFAVLPTPNERALKLPKQESTAAAETVIERVVETVVETVIEERIVQRQSRVITRPVRSGQQIYAEGADLIVLSQVSEGAEVLAD